MCIPPNVVPTNRRPTKRRSHQMSGSNGHKSVAMQLNKLKNLLHVITGMKLQLNPFSNLKINSQAREPIQKLIVMKPNGQVSNHSL